MKDLIEIIMSTTSVRYLDTTVWTALATCQPRDEDAIQAELWPDADHPNPQSPYVRCGHGRLLPNVTDHQYRIIYNRLLEPANLEFELLEIEDFADFCKF